MPTPLEEWRKLPKAIAPHAALCPKCKGMRFLQFDVLPGHPLFDKIAPCPLCRLGTSTTSKEDR